MMNNLNNLSPAEEDHLIASRMGKENLIDFAIVTDKGYQVGWHHRVTAEKLQEAYHKVKRGERVRLIIEEPPRHGKSELGTIKFPGWVLGLDPSFPFIVVSYAQELANDFGLGTKDLMNSNNYQALFNTRLRADSKAKAKWMTEENGGYTAVGVGGPITGKGFKIGIIDDPFKNREEADSEVIREKVWKWYRSTFLTREEGNGAVIIIMCMTGDTLVKMADGSECELRNINVGDKICTYVNGKLYKSTVKNWTSCGNDKVLKVMMSNGKIIKANGRHPFLTYYNKKLQWTRTKNLTTAHKIVTLKDNGENGKAKNVLQMTVKNQQFAGGIVPRTITKRSGLMDIALRQLTKIRVVKQGLNIVMGLLSKSMTNSLNSKMEDVQFASNYQAKMCEPIGMGNSVLTTTTKQERLEHCFVTIATLRLVIQKIKRLLWPWQGISDFTLSDIISIEKGGIEEVFDMQVDKTENFIANGVVSHNTRWHDDDLVGRLLNPKINEKWKEWERVTFPAIAIEDEKYRKKGEALWPEKFPLEILKNKKIDLGPYEWSALYQQNPVDEEAREFKQEWFKPRELKDVLALDTRRFVTIDPASALKEGSDFIGVVVNYVDRENKWNLSAYKLKIDAMELIDFIFKMNDDVKPEEFGIEEGVYNDVIKPFIEEEMRKRNKFITIIPLKHKQQNKELRIRGLIPRYSSGNIYHIERQCADLEEELARFPKGVHDDVADACAYQNQLAKRPKERKPFVQKKPPNPWKDG